MTETESTSLLSLNTELEDRHDAMVRRLAKPGADILLAKPAGFADLSQYDQTEWLSRRDEKLEGLTFNASRANINHACIGLGGEPGEIAVLLTLKDGTDSLTTGMLEETGDAYFYARLLRQELGSQYVPLSIGEVLRLIASHHPEIDAFEFTREINLVTGYVMLNLGVGIAVDAMKRVFIYNGQFDSKFKDRDLTFRQAGIDGLQIIEFALGLMLAQVDKTRDDALEANWYKLEGSKDSRYKDGYSDAAAHARADKAAEVKTGPDDEPLTGGACDLGEACESC